MATITNRTTKDGSTRYAVEIRMRGFPPQRKTFTRLTDAKKWARNTEAAIEAGDFSATAAARKHTLAELIDRYEKEILPTKRSSKSQKYQLEYWKKKIGAYLLSDISTALIEECIPDLTKPNKHGKVLTPASVNRYLAALSHVYTKAVKKWEWCASNPVLNVDKQKEPDGRIRFLTDSERTKLLAACKASSNKYLYTVVVLALSTGMRQNEIMSLQRNQIDLENNRITLFKTKNGTIRVVPLVGHAHDLVRELPTRVDTQLLFPSNVDKDKPILLRTVWASALEVAEITDFRFHDLRHTAASAFAMNGASLLSIAKILGHKTVAVTQRYAHLTEQHTADEVEAMNAKMFGVDNG